MSCFALVHRVDHDWGVSCVGTRACIVLWQNVQAHKYHTREQFMEDVELIYVNCLSYNGPDSNFTQTARKLMEVCRDSINEVICWPFSEMGCSKKNPSALELRDLLLVAAFINDCVKLYSGQKCVHAVSRGNLFLCFKEVKR